MLVKLLFKKFRVIIGGTFTLIGLSCSGLLAACNSGSTTPNVIPQSSTTLILTSGADANGYGAIYSYANGVWNTIASHIGVYGMPIYSLAFESSTNTLYAGGADTNGYGAVYSYKFGGSLQIVESNLGTQGNGINTLAIASDGTLYAGGADANGYGAIYTFTNGVLSGTESNIGGGPIYVLALTSNNILYAAGTDSSSITGAVYSYTNGNLTTIESHIGVSTVNSLAVASNGNLYVGGTGANYHGALYSFINGDWNLVESNIGSANIDALVVTNESIIYIGGSDLNESGAIFSYSNGTLTTIESGIGSGGYLTQGGITYPLYSSVASLALNNGTLYAGGTDNNESGALYSYANSNFNTIKSGVGSPTPIPFAPSSQPSLVPAFISAILIINR